MEATPRRLARARERFGRPTSAELTAGCALVVAAIALPGAAAGLVAALGALWNAAVDAARSQELQLPAGAGGSLVPSAPLVFGRLSFAPWVDAAQLSVGMLVALALTAAAATALQRGVFVRIAGAGDSSFDARIPPETKAARLARAAFSLVKWLVFVAALLGPWSDAVRGMLGAWQRAPGELMPIAGGLMLAVLERAAIALAVLGALDFVVQQGAFRRRLRMSHQELQEEQKATEADPHATAERKRRGRELQARVALQELDQVSVLVCDLERRAFGVREKGEDMMVWVKAEGGDLVARVRTEAEARGLPVMIDRELAALLASREVGETLPPPIVNRLRRKPGS
jgi:flagellar biosynthesis protein FlhB